MSTKLRGRFQMRVVYVLPFIGTLDRLEITCLLVQLSVVSSVRPFETAKALVVRCDGVNISAMLWSVSYWFVC